MNPSPPVRTAALPTPSRRRFFAVLAAAVVLCNLVAIALGVSSMLDSRNMAERTAEQTASNLAGVLDQGIANSARTIDIALQALVDELERHAARGDGYLSADQIVSMLRRVRNRLPETVGIQVYDADGRLRWVGSGTPGVVNIADREYFIALRSNPKAGMVVSRPIVGRVAKDWLMPFARRFTRPDGSFAGIVSAVVPLTYFNGLLARPSLGPSGTAVLRYADFSLIARVPQVAGAGGQVGHQWVIPETRARLQEGQTTFSYRTAQTSDGIARTLAVRRVDGLPFLIVVGLACVDYLAQWRSDALQTGILLGIFALVSSASAVAVGLFYRRQQDEALRTQAGNVRLTAALAALSDRDRALAAAERIGKLGVYSVDLASGVTTSSPPLHDVFRVPRDRPFGPVEWRELVHPDDTEVIPMMLVGLMRDGRDFDRSYRIIGGDGALRWVHGIGQMLRDEAGRPLGIHGAVQDVTDYKRVEASLQAALTDYERLVERIPVGLVGFRWEPGASPRFTYASPRFCEQLGLSVDEVLADSQRVFARVHPDDRRDLCSVTMARVGDSPDFVWEGRVCIDGTTRWLSVLARPTPLGDGSVLWEGVQADVTDRRQAENARCESEERYHLLLEHSPVGILHYDRELRVNYCNLQFACIMGVPHAYVLSLDCTTLDDQRIVPVMRAALDGALGSYEGAYRTAYSGREIEVQISCAPLRDAAGAIVGGIAILQDVTERLYKDRELARYRDSLEGLVAERTADLEAARAEAERLTRVKSEFLANMSHEIRTPLNGVLGLARIGYRESAGRDAARATFERILSSGQLLLGIINDILDFSKIEAGKLGIEAIPVDLGRVIGDTLALMEERAAAKALTLRLLRSPSLPAACLGDPLRIGQVLVNLLSNAIKFTDHGSVTLWAGTEGGELVLRVSDTGIGMSREEIDKVFAPFEQADNSTTRKFGGTGLGLTITHRIVALMGGTLSARSVPGEGSTFEVRLPCVPVAAPPPAALADAGASGARLAGLRVLVAEDNEVNQLVLEDQLCSEGAAVTVVGNGREAVDCVREHGAGAFDVVLMDVQMPVMDGHEAARRLRAIAPGLPVIGQTAHALDGERAACLAAGMVDHLAKPIDPERMVASILRHRRQR